MTMRRFNHWDRLDRVAEDTGLDIRTLMWSNPFLPTDTLPYLPPDGYQLNVPAGSLNPDFSPVPADLQALASRLAR